MDNTELVGKLWSLCNVLRDDGITFHQYLSELSTLLFLKMAKETGTERPIPVGWRWSDLKALKGKALLDHYRHLFTHLASH